MSLEKYWYIVALSEELGQNKIISRKILDHDLVCFRDKNNTPIIFEDRCIHRCSKLSSGSCKNGILQCSYHGWQYDETGRVIFIPSESNEKNQLLLNKNSRKRFYAKKYHALEQDGYIYVNLSSDDISTVDKKPYDMPYYNHNKWDHVRLINLFNNNIANCVENFIDVPHTIFVHPGIFRTKSNETINVDITREHNRVYIEYKNETDNLGYFSKILNPSKKPIIHTDEFIAPNITHVEYILPNGWQYMITSQSVPINIKNQTLVYTDITYNFGIFTKFVKWLVRNQAQKVIDQDVKILNEQQEVINKHGENFLNSSADIIHVYISEIINNIINNNYIKLEKIQRTISFNI